MNPFSKYLMRIPFIPSSCEQISNIYSNLLNNLFSKNRKKGKGTAGIKRIER
jgi:hypothetical protein